MLTNETVGFLFLVAFLLAANLLPWLFCRGEDCLANDPLVIAIGEPYEELAAEIDTQLARAGGDWT